MSDKDRQIAEEANEQTERAVAEQVVKAAPGIIAGVIGWIKSMLGGAK